MSFLARLSKGIRIARSFPCIYQNRSFWFGKNNTEAEQAAEKAAEDLKRQQSSKLRGEVVSTLFRRSSNQDTIEFMKHKAKYWKPQLELSAPSTAIEFGSLPVTTFSGQKAELPVLAAGEPFFLTLLFRDAFHPTVFDWARLVFQTTTRWNRAADMPPPSIARQQGGMPIHIDLPPAPLYQMVVLEGLSGRLLSGVMMRNTRDALRKRWQECEAIGSRASNATVATVGSVGTEGTPQPAPTSPHSQSLPPPSTESTQPAAASSSSSSAVAQSLRERGACEWATQEQRLLAHLGNIDDRFLLPLGALNKLGGYVFLLDGAGRVRWKGCGQASEEEAAALPGIYQQLLHEHLHQQQLRDACK